MPHNTTRPEYNDELRRIRDELGMTQPEFGEALGVNKDTVSRYERGDRHVPEPTIRLARSLLPKSRRLAAQDRYV